MFLPSTHGFKFDNDFPDEPLISVPIPIFGTINLGNAGYGVCGGMVFAALDYYLANTPIPANTKPPEPETDFFKFLVRRFIDSVDPPFGLFKAYCWMAYNGSLYAKSKAELDKLDGLVRPVPLTLIEVQSLDPRQGKENHQVLAYDVEDNVIKIYDPNYPLDDNVTLSLSDNKVMHSGEGEIRGFYITEGYARHKPV